MAMQDRANANHDVGKDAKIYYVLDKGTMVASPLNGAKFGILVSGSSINP